MAQEVEELENMNLAGMLMRNQENINNNNVNSMMFSNVQSNNRAQ